MTKFKQFSDFLVGRNIVSEPSLNHLRRVLRNAGLVSSGGQGFASKPLEVSDVTNIVIALVAADQVQNAPDVVKLYRSASFDDRFSDDCSPWPFGNVGQNDNLGAFLDCFFEGLLANAAHPDWHWTNLRFKFDIVDGQTTANPSFWFDDGSYEYTARFHAENRDFVSEIKQGNVSRVERHIGQISRKAYVNDEFLRPIVWFVVNGLFPDDPEAE